VLTAEWLQGQPTYKYLSNVFPHVVKDGSNAESGFILKVPSENLVGVFPDDA
jgi:hypothetical protein